MIHPKVNKTRLLKRLSELAEIGAHSDGGVCRLALSNEDKVSRDLVVQWMKNLDLKIHVDQVGNLIGIRIGKTDLALVAIGSHIDTVPSGGRFDGAVGVIAGLEVLETLNDYEIQTERPIAVIVFTDEEGVRFSTDLLGSRAFCGFMSPVEACAIKGTDGTNFGEELKRIGYAGEFPCGCIRPYSYVELHIEQGPVLDREQIPIGIVTAITGLTWFEITIQGEANHAGTTPTRMRHDAGLTAASIITFLREIALSLGENQRATCGVISFSPNAINVIPDKAILSVDLRNSDKTLLKEAEHQLLKFLRKCARQDGVHIDIRLLAHIQPEPCHPDVVATIIESAQESGYLHRSMISGAVHDALTFTRYCPTGMIFVPSKNGINHNPKEFTRPRDLVAGANVLLNSVLKLAKVN